jgi:hypothetical protein
MAHASLHQKDVRELQQLAQDASTMRRRPRKRPPSRASMLELIDILSRWSATGLAFIAGLSIYLAITVGSAYPARAASWTALMLAALWVCRRLRSQFRSGGTIAARPFHWRASYTSCLSVLGVIFASAPILLTPSGAPTVMYLQVTAIALFGAFAAAMVHSAHLSTAAALAVPAAILPGLSALRMGDTALLVAITAISAMGLAVTYGVSRTVAADAARRNPRTTLVPRDMAYTRKTVLAPSTATPAASAL